MSWSRWVTCCVASVMGLSLCTARPEPGVQLVGECTKLRWDEAVPASSPLLPSGHSAHEGVELHAGRGEVLGLQLLFSDRADHEIALTFERPALHVQGFRVRHVSVDSPSTGMYGDSRGAGSYPDLLVPIEDVVTTRRAAFFDIRVAPEAQPGRYSGTLSIDDREVEVRMNVHQARIELREDPLVWVFYHPDQLAKRHGFVDADSAEAVQMEERYHELFRRHGTFLASDLPPERFRARAHLMGATEFWPVAVDTSDDASIARDVRWWLNFFEHKPNVTPFVIAVDEPRNRPQRLHAKRVAQTIQAAGGLAPRLLTAVTDTTHPIYEGVFDIYFSPQNWPLEKTIKEDGNALFWTYNGKPPQAGSMIIDTNGVALRTWGWIAFRFDLPLWYAWEGLYFADRYNDGQSTDLLRDPVTFDERSGNSGGRDFGNGDGLLAYPGALPSLRLKALRRGLQDRLLLLSLSNCGAEDEAREMARQMLPTALGAAGKTRSWPIDEGPWERMRKRLLRRIDESCHG